MKFHKIIVRILLPMAAWNFSIIAMADEQLPMEEQWSCSGWCLLGADTPTNPWIPVSSTGATEQEARDNIDCGIYEEVGITCRQAQ
jgi:hypothetical protein